MHPLWDIGWGNTSFDINAFKAHSKQKDIKQDDFIHYGTFDGAILLLISMLAFKAHSKQKDIKQGDTCFYLNAFPVHSKKWAGFFRVVMLFNMVFCIILMCNQCSFQINMTSLNIVQIELQIDVFFVVFTI